MESDAMDRVTITINGSPVDAREGETVLDAALREGVAVPSLCRSGAASGRPMPEHASCGACLVAVEGRVEFCPSCVLPVSEGLSVRATGEDLDLARRLALELLLSDHTGDCLGPCERVCPEGIDVPRIMENLRAGRTGEAASLLGPWVGPEGVVCKSCAARCEKACRRQLVDEPVAIREVMLLLAQSVDPSAERARPELDERVRVTMSREAVEASLEGVEKRPRQSPSDLDDAALEAERCLLCDCAKKRACELREVATAVGASPRTLPGERPRWSRDESHDEIVYEPGKCIRCGRCIAVAASDGEELGLTFMGRGFGVRIGVPFGGSMAQGLKRSGAECAEACPTGALYLRRDRKAAVDGCFHHRDHGERGERRTIG